MSPIRAAIEHYGLKTELDAARADGGGWWIQEALGALTHFVEERYAPQRTADSAPAPGNLPHRVPDTLLILSLPIPAGKEGPPSWMSGKPRQFPAG